MSDPIRQPRSLGAATELCERFALLDGQIAAIEERRQADIAAINADADRAAADLIAQRDAIAAKLEPWWDGAAAELTKGKRKSIELGGCQIGTRELRPTLQIAGDEKDVVAALSALRWAKPFLAVKVSLDRAHTLKSIDGKYAATFAELGVTRREAVPVFYVKRAEQGGTRTAG